MFALSYNEILFFYQIIFTNFLTNFLIFFFQATSNQGSTNVNTTQNGHNGQQNGDSIGIGTAHILEKEAIDIKDVELTLLPSYLHSEQESVNVIDNTDLLQSISKPNPQLSPPKRPPRSNHSPEGNYILDIWPFYSRKAWKYLVKLNGYKDL